ncbi:MAG TPA: hypothetical protein VFQ53_26640 [Kofleriaceae bacterium]|nr:hypothetical protein [Kofleriaceae bacterium]
MRKLGFLIAVACAAGCGFGDNGARPGEGPDASPGTDGPVNPDGKLPTDGPVEAACTIIPQSGCAAGDACDFGEPATGPFACRDVTVSGTADSRCSVETECAAGFTCIKSGTKAWCNRFCDSDAQCGSGARCVNEITSGGVVLAERVCSNACNILGQTGCPTGLGCMGFEDGDRDYTDCVVNGTKLDGQACTTDTDCIAGSVCVDFGASGGGPQCREFCNKSNPSNCSSGICDSFAVELKINAVDFGFCRL